MNLKSFWSLVLAMSVCLIIPSIALAQEPSETPSMETVESNVVEPVHTAKDNFGGFYLGLNAYFGQGRCDDKICHGDDDWDSIYTGFSMILGLEAAYLWGEEIFVGLAISGYYEHFLLGGGDLRFKLVMPWDANNAVKTTLGLGGGGHGGYDEACYLGECYLIGGNDYGAPHYMYIPFSLGYDHVFDFGLLLGVSLEVHMAFHRVAQYDEYKWAPYVGFVGAGINVGYIW